MLTSHHTRARLASERGQASVNWLGIMVGLVILAGALVVALPSAAPVIVCAAQNMVAKATGGAVPDCNHTAALDADVPDPSTCVVSERSGEAGVTVTVFSVKGGAKVTLITRRTADGKVYVTVQGGQRDRPGGGDPGGRRGQHRRGLRRQHHAGRERQGRRQAPGQRPGHVGVRQRGQGA